MIPEVNEGTIKFPHPFNKQPMNVVINKTIGIGDAGIPFDVSIDVDYEQHGNQIMIFDWMEEQSPYDNPPESWYGRMKDIISDYFYEQNESFNVAFK